MRALDEVRCHLLAVSGPADNDAKRAFVVDDGLTCRETHGRVGVERVVLRVAVIHNLVAGLLEVLNQVLSQFKTRVVRGNMYTHAPIIGAPSVGARSSSQPAIGFGFAHRTPRL